MVTDGYRLLPVGYMLSRVMANSGSDTRITLRFIRATRLIWPILKPILSPGGYDETKPIALPCP